MPFYSLQLWAILHAEMKNVYICIHLPSGWLFAVAVAAVTTGAAVTNPSAQ
jgi:hypothetical protein